MITPEKTIRRESLILRVLWMLLFLLVWQIAVPLLGVLVVAQLLYRLFYAAPSALLMSFGDSLSQYLAQIGRFAVFNTDEKPWPIADWPCACAADGESAHSPKTKTVVEPLPTVSPATVKTTEPLESAADAETAETAETLAAPATEPESDTPTDVSAHEPKP